MLVHHSDAHVDGVTWLLNFNTIPAHNHLTLIGSVQAIEDIHEGRFARTIFTQEGMDLPLVKIEINLVVGKYTRETLRYSTQLEDRFHDHLNVCWISRGWPISGQADCTMGFQAHQLIQSIKQGLVETQPLSGSANFPGVLLSLITGKRKARQR
jgi:hypothetical protein